MLKSDLVKRRLKACSITLALPLLLLFSVAPTGAATRPLQAALCCPIQVHAPEQSIRGLRLDLGYGKNSHVTGLDLGLVNHTTGDETAMQASLLGLVKGHMSGVQYGFIHTAGQLSGCQWGFAGIAGNMEGAQVGCFNITGSATGLQWGVFDIAGDCAGMQMGAMNITGNLNGIQFGAMNITGNLDGMQIGLGNISGYVERLQLGLVNVTGEINGLQIGVINVIERGGWFPVLPIINGRR